MSQRPTIPDVDEDGGIGPYVFVVLVAVVLMLMLGVYVFSYFDELRAIMIQHPT